MLTEKSLAAKVFICDLRSRRLGPSERTRSSWNSLSKLPAPSTSFHSTPFLCTRLVRNFCNFVVAKSWVNCFRLDLLENRERFAQRGDDQSHPRHLLPLDVKSTFAFRASNRPMVYEMTSKIYVEGSKTSICQMRKMSVSSTKGRELKIRSLFGGSKKGWSRHVLSPLSDRNVLSNSRNA